jgi:SAM-dependent methyltransferase
MLPEEARAVAEHQRRRFNELVDVFDRPQPPEVMERLWEIVASAELYPEAVVLDVGTGVGVLIPLIQSYRPSSVVACDVAEKMLQRVQDKYPRVRTHHTDIASLDLASTSVDAIFMNGMYGNIAISARVKIDRITARERGVMRRSKSRPPDSCFTRHGCLRG